MYRINSPCTGDDAIEQELVAKGATAPRVRPEDIEANIASEHYFIASDALQLLPDAVHRTPDDSHGWLLGDTQALTICILQLRNGFTVLGHSKPVSRENFDAEIGRKLARANAVEQLWPLMGYALKQHLRNMEKYNEDIRVRQAWPWPTTPEGSV